MIRTSGVHNRCPFVSEDTLTSVGDDGRVSLAVRNKASHEKTITQSKTVLGEAEPTTFVFRPMAVDQTDKASVPIVEQSINIDAVDLSDTSSELSSFAQNFLSSTEMSEKGLPENEKRERSDPQLLTAIPGSDLFSVLSFWGKVLGTSSRMF